MRHMKRERKITGSFEVKQTNDYTQSRCNVKKERIDRKMKRILISAIIMIACFSSAVFAQNFVGTVTNEVDSKTQKFENQFQYKDVDKGAVRNRSKLPFNQDNYIPHPIPELKPPVGSPEPENRVIMYDAQTGQETV
ncbi:MAG: hypothetical protein GY855_17035, partial [candidate division Zixibacteria bacterium]|nr:hypothetical protein [candidate division Zixibacteria bacterium]